MNEEEVRKIIDNMSEQELNDFIFFALQEVEKCLGISRKNISQCITGKNKTAGGFKWVTHEQMKSIEYKVEE